ncbi:MAG: guanylate kinase [Pseudomonadales bacterium]|nr:guanylate kinase [Pseudomonadales bacterium]
MTTGRLYVISAPSGAGKTSLIKALIEVDEAIGVAVSHTTRHQRSGETDGVNYHFVTEQVFQQMVEADEFLEWATVFEHLYGTSIAAADKVLADGQHLILEIDWQGAMQVRQRQDCAQTIFVFPPSYKALRARLLNRAQDDTETVEKRLSTAFAELSHYQEFDYLVVNDDFNVALNELKQIVHGNGQTFRRSLRLPQLQNLLADLELT